MMTGTLVRVSLRHRWAVMAAAGLMIVLGALAGAGLGIDVLPDVSRPRLTVMVEAPTLAAEEVESLVTRPLELALTGLPSAVRMRTSSAMGLAVLDVDLDWGADTVAARQQAAERLTAASRQLPPGIVPQIQPISSIMGEIMLVALTGGRDANLIDVRSFADFVVRPRLSVIPGVSQVTVIGGDVAHFRVSPRLATMAGLDISPADLERALTRFGSNAGGGFTTQADSEFVIRTIGSRPNRSALGGVVVTKRNGAPVLLKDVADVALAAKPARGSAGFDGQVDGILSVDKQPAADTRTLTTAVTAELAALQRAAPTGMEVNRLIFRQADFINVGLGNVRRAVIESFLVVTVVLLLALGNVRTTFISLA